MSQFLQFYQYIFYWGYEWKLRNHGEQSGPYMTGVGIVYLLCFLNAFTLLDFSNWLLYTNLVLPDLPWYVSWPAAFLLMLPHFLYFNQGGRYRTIVAKFDAWDADRRRSMNRRVILYILGSLLTWGMSLYLTKNYPNPLHLPW